VSNEQHKRAPIVPSHQAREVLIEAVIEMVQTMSVEEITSRAIGERIQMDPQVIFRNFGSVNNLLAEASKELARRFAPLTTTATFIESMSLMAPRYKILLYLLGRGFPGEQLIADDGRETLELIKGRIRYEDLPERINNAMAIVSVYAVEGVLAFQQIHPFTSEEMLDAVELFNEITRRVGSLSQALEWSN
jgi:hypothetical protein